MSIRRYKKISELDPITTASLETYVAGVDNGETVKITLEVLASGVRDTINTLDNIRLTNLENYTASFSASTELPIGTISSSAQITALGFISSSQTIDTGSFVTTSSFQSFSSSVHTEILAATNEQSFNGLISGSEQVLGGSGVYSSSAQIDGFETTGRGILSGSISYTSLTDIPEGIVSGSDQLTSSLNELYVLSGSVQNVILPDGLISSSTQIELLGFVTTSQNVYVTTQSFYEFTQSFYQFTGSVNGTFVSTSSFNDYTTSISTGSLVDRLNSLEGNTGSYETTGRNILSGSILDLLPNGVVSGSEQVLGGSGVWSGSVQLPSGVVSGSSQVLGGSGVYSSSAQIDGFETIGRGIVSSSTQITSFGFVSGSYETTGRGIISSSVDLVTTSSFNTYTASISTASLVTSIDNLNTFTASQSTSSLVNRLNVIESVSGSWITESETGSFLTNLNGAISGSSQLTASYDSRYVLSGSIVSSGGASVTTSDTAPSSPSEGDLWWKTNDGNLYVYYDGYWVISTDTIAALPNGVVSGSSQLTSSFDGRYTLSGSILATPAWTSAGAITIGATTTAPTKGTRTQDNISYRQLGSKEWEVVMTYYQTANTGAANGSGDYLFTLPNSLSFDTSVPSQQLYTANVGTSSWYNLTYVIPSGGGGISNGVTGGRVYPVVYNSTQFRILTINDNAWVKWWGSGHFQIGDSSYVTIQLTFRFTST